MYFSVFFLLNYTFFSHSFSFSTFSLPPLPMLHLNQANISFSDAQAHQKGFPLAARVVGYVSTYALGGLRLMSGVSLSNSSPCILR